jgi:hypothetical protein
MGVLVDLGHVESTIGATWLAPGNEFGGGPTDELPAAASSDLQDVLQGVTT